MKEHKTKPYTKNNLQLIRRRWNTEFQSFGHKYGLKEAKLAHYAVERDYIRPGMQILEVGAGSGRNALYFARNKIQTTAIDLSDVGIALLCQEMARNLELTADIVSLRLDFFDSLRFLKNGIFDVIFSNFCLHLLDPTLRDEFFMVSSALLKPNGQLVLSLLSTADEDYKKAKRGEFGSPLGKDTWQIRGHPQHFFGKAEAQGIFSVDSNNHLELVTIEAFREIEKIIAETRKTGFWILVGKKVAN